MSDRSEPEEAVEVVDGLPVLAEADEHELAGRAPTGVAVAAGRGQAVALAATGFLAGAATVALAHRRKTAKMVARRRRGKAVGFGEVLTSNSFLVDVHLLRRD